MQEIRVCLLAAVLATAAGLLPVHAQDNAKKNDNLAAEVDAHFSLYDDKGYAGGYMHGAVKQDIKQTALAIKTLGESIHKAKRTAIDLYGEVTHREMLMVGDPDIIGGVGANVIPDVSGTGGALEVGGYLPPRKSWVNLHVSQLDQMLSLIQEDIQSFVVPDANKAVVDPLIVDMKTALQDAQAHAVKLNNLIKMQDYGNISIANECSPIHDDLNKMEDIRKNIWRLLKK